MAQGQEGQEPGTVATAKSSLHYSVIPVGLGIGLQPIATNYTLGDALSRVRTKVGVANGSDMKRV